MEPGQASSATCLTPADSESVSLAVVGAVAEAEDVSMLQMEPLASVVDPDALDELVESMEAGPFEPDGAVEFRYGGYDVTVTGTGFVSITRVEPPE